MGVSLEIYRQRIGCYSKNGPKQKYFPVKSAYYWKNNNLLSIKMLLISFVLLHAANLICVFQPVGRSWSSSSLHCKSSSYQHCQLAKPVPMSFHPFGISWSSSSLSNKICIMEAVFQPVGMTWSYSNKGNKLAHALNGNKRNPGYKYLEWNCARGFLKEHKIDDLKVTINRHKPHLVAVTEVDLHRDENNHDLFSTTNFSTDELHEKLQIQGYNIFLPKSWETFNTARPMLRSCPECNS